MPRKTLGVLNRETVASFLTDVWLGELSPAELLDLARMLRARATAAEVLAGRKKARAAAVAYPDDDPLFPA